MNRLVNTLFKLAAMFAGLAWLSLPVLSQAQEPPASQPSSPPASAPAVTQDHIPEQKHYTCPMHPQIMEDSPGDCPICGMDLIPKKVAAKKPEPKAPESKKGVVKGSSEPREILYWIAPMDPSYRRDKPGKSPMGMDLVPVYKGGGGSTVAIDPIVVQNMGVRIARVQRGSLTRRIRTIGNVQVAENLQAVVNLRYSGWIERLHVDETGVRVTKGQALFDVYSPELVSAQQEYLIALRTGGKGTALAKSAKRRLELFGVSRSVIRDVEKKGLRTRFTVRAPLAGYVVHHDVVAGSRVMAGQDLYRIADLSQVWIEAAIYEHDAPWLKLGTPAVVTLSFQSGEARKAKVDYIYPMLNPRTRTVRVRLVLPNPDLTLKPGAFATVEIDAQHHAEALLVPSEAIINSGARQVVFVALEAGSFEARDITTGLVGSQSRTEVLGGLQEGERVVTSGQFLLDSESQLQEAVQKMLRDRLAASQAFAPMSEADDAEDTKKGTYWTCSMHPQVVEDDPGTCPICGMDLVEKQR